MGGQDLDAGTGEVLRGEPAVVTDDDAAIGGAGLLEVLGDAAGAASHVMERVVLGDGGTPSIGAEPDLRHGQLTGGTGVGPWRDGRPSYRLTDAVAVRYAPISRIRGSSASRSPTPMR